MKWIVEDPTPFNPGAPGYEDHYVCILRGPGLRDGAELVLAKALDRERQRRKIAEERAA